MEIGKKGKQLFAVLLSVAMIITAMPLGVVTVNAVTTEFAGGSGTEDDPYLIVTKEHLNNVRDDLDAHYKMIADIEFTDADFEEGGSFYNDGKGWTPIGNGETSFSGSFDGCGFTVYGLKIDEKIDDSIYIGLFGYSTTAIKNLDIKNSVVNVTGDSTVQSGTTRHAYVGAIVGCGDVENCSNYGIVNVVYSSTKLPCAVYMGGVTGRATNVTGSCNYGSISFKLTSTSNYVPTYMGGVVGNGDALDRCQNQGEISATVYRNDPNVYVGGIAGSATSISRCSNVAKIIARHTATYGACYVGGICGVGSGFTVDQCYNMGFIDDAANKSAAGGIVGYAGGGTVKNSYNNGFIQGGWCGGIVGHAFSTVAIKNCYNTGLIEDGYYKYSIIGSSSLTPLIENCYSLEGIANACSLTTVCTAEEMGVQSTYVGFDFNDIWRMGNGASYTCPDLIGLPIAIDPQVKRITDCEITLDKFQVQYSTSQPKVTVMFGEEKLLLGEDYILKFIDGDKSWVTASDNHGFSMSTLGSAKIFVVGINDFTNIKIINFEVIKFDLSNAELYTPWVSSGHGGQTSSGFMMEDFTYDGSEKKQSGFRVGDGNFDTIDSSNYEITYRNNIEVGTATMIITGKGDYYTGTLEKEFNIYPRSISSIEVSALPNKVTYKKGARKIDVTGGKITIRYQDGGVETIDMRTDMLDGDYNLSMVGSQNIWLKYQNYAFYFKITVAEIKRGDCNNDGKITVTDMLAVKAHILGKSILSGDAAVAADTNQDGKITITDFIQIKAHILGKSTIEQ